MKGQVGGLRTELEILRDLKPSLPRKVQRLRTSGNLREHKLSTSLESVEFTKKKRECKDLNQSEASKGNRSNNKSKLSNSVDRKQNQTQFAAKLNKSFEKRIFDTLKAGRGFEKSLMVNFKDFLKLQKTKDNTKATNL